MSLFDDLRSKYHRRVCAEIVRITKDGSKEHPNFADAGNRISIAVSWDILRHIGCENYLVEASKGQTSGGRFESITKDYLQESFDLLNHMRPGEWVYGTGRSISGFAQYAHLRDLEQRLRGDIELASSLGNEYIITPDIVISKMPASDEEINAGKAILTNNSISGRHSTFRKINSQQPLLHASISCKWTLRSDRGQNARTEALNLIRNRKGHLPHVVAVTAEPLPTRIASLALGTGDLDCVYHFALAELIESVKVIDPENVGQGEALQTLILGKRLRDISDLPLDLAA